MDLDRASAVDLLRRLVAIDSTNPDLVPGGAGEAEIARFVAAWLKRAGLAVELIDVAPGRPNVVAVAPGSGGGLSLMLNAHSDTVAAGGMARPHEPVVEGNRLYGRGAWDMKGSLAAIMLVAAEAHRRRLSSGRRGDLILTAVVDEEYASLGTQSVVAAALGAGPPPDAAIVAEPTGLDVCIAHKGFVWFEVETRGVAAHGSRSDLGVDAIAKMGPVLVGLDALDRDLRAGPAHPLLGPASIHASLIAGGQELSTYPDHCRLAIERRTIPGETATGAEGQVRAVLDRAAAGDPAFSAALRTTLVREPFAVAPDAPIVDVVRRRAREALGREPALVGVGGWMDSALLATAGVPTVVFGPAGEGAHADVEWVDLDTVVQCAEVLLAVTEDFCA